MRTINLFCVLLAWALAFGQPTKTAIHVLTVPAGSMTCAFTHHQPTALTGIHVSCVSSTGSLDLDTVLAPSPSNGQFGQFLSGKDIIIWRLQLPVVGGRVMYQISANGVAEVGSL